MDLRDTIVAISTPLARSGLGVLRLSGTESRAVAERILTFPRGPAWEPWRLQQATLSDVDSVVVAFFAAPRSYTAEDVVEISCHGAPIILTHALSLAATHGARLAEPGEFTLRAFVNGRIDLPQAEAIRDLIDATTLYQARMAASQMEGSVSRRLRPAKEQLVRLISILEAGIDFAEDDVAVASADQIRAELAATAEAVRHLRASFDRGRLVTSGFTLAIAGKPNVGKSSLFNRLLEQDRAIVTDMPGTTRDTVAETASLEGLPVRLVDTAGIRESSDTVEILGIERSFEAIADADLIILVLDGSAPADAEDRRLLQRLSDRNALVVANKSDLPQADMPASLRVSARTGAGLESLRGAILERITPGGLASPEEGVITSIRHEQLLGESLGALTNAANALEFGLPHELLLIDLYAALRPIDAITGATTADDILHRIFATFCIGK